MYIFVFNARHDKNNTKKSNSLIQKSSNKYSKPNEKIGYGI